LKLQVEKQRFRFSLAKCRVLVCRHLDSTLSVYYGPHLIGRYSAQGLLIQPGRLASRSQSSKAA